jgi:SAM-dependent methyltransferase
MSQDQDKLGNDYDPVAKEYGDHFFHELDGKPLDRQLLDELAKRVGDLGPICDMGCGPGQIARYLHDNGASALGVDLSAEMVKVARELSPEIEFHQGDMMALDFEDNSWGGIAAFYSIIHIPKSKIVDTLGEFLRVLRPGGWLLVSFHIGDELLHVEEFFEKPVDLDFIFFPTAEVKGYIQAAGFEKIEAIEREPYVGVEHESRRAYIFAQKPV